MPGRLMEHHALPELEEGGERPPKRQRIEATPSQLNGVKPDPGNMIRQEPRAASPSQSLAILRQTLQDSYPNIEHITAGFYPLSTLYERLSQECATDLADLLDNMPASSSTLQTNGVSNPQVQPLLSSVDANRKRTWLDYARKHRDRFIKALVLTKWSAQANEASRLIDISNWLHYQSMHYETALWRLADIKRHMSRLKIPSPDIETAVDVLSTGSILRAPDLGYIPPPALTSAKLLQNLRNINILLHIRLTRHEDLPAQLRNYKIHSGRVTFTAPGEFELDLSIADEDPVSQFYLIDLRLLFSPTTDIPASLLHGTLEPRANVVLAKEGLSGCFKLLRNLILTHKMNILRRQAYQLNAKSWAGSLRVEPTHRSLVLQYWKERPAGKNWIEIGVKSGCGVDGETSIEEDQFPLLGVRWFRSGKEVFNFQLELDPTNLDVERILNSVVAQHMSLLLSQMRDAAYPMHRPTLFTSSLDPRLCSLAIPFHSPFGPRKVVLVFEPLSGKITLQPWSQATARYEDAINRLRDPAVEVWSQIQRFQSSEIQAEVETFAAQSALMPLQEIDGRLGFGDAPRVRVFRIPGDFPVSWAIAWVMSADGKCNWKVVELEMSLAGSNSVKRCQNLVEQTPSTAHGLIRISSQKILMLMVEDQLKAIQAKFSFGSGEADELKVIIERHSVLPDSGRTGLLWACDDFVLQASANTHDDKYVHGKAMEASHIIYGRLHLSQAMRDALEAAKAFTEDFRHDGRFGLRLHHNFDSNTIITDAIRRLKGLQRLCALVATLCRTGLKPLRADLSQVDFSYGKGQDNFRASVAFGSSNNERLLLAFQPPNNPHHLIQNFLADKLNEMGAVDSLSRFENFVVSLQSTLPVLRALHHVLTDDKKARIVLTVHDLCWYKLTYAEFPLTLDVRLRLRREQQYWTVGLSEMESFFALPEASRLRQSLQSVFESRGPSWFGVRTGAIAQSEEAVPLPGAAASIMEHLLLRINKSIEACNQPDRTPPPVMSSKNAVPIPRQTNGAAQNSIKPVAKAPSQSAKQPVRKEKPKPGKIEMPANPVFAAAAATAAPATSQEKHTAPKQEVITLD